MSSDRWVRADNEPCDGTAGDEKKVAQQKRERRKQNGIEGERFGTVCSTPNENHPTRRAERKDNKENM